MIPHLERGQLYGIIAIFAAYLAFAVIWGDPLGTLSSQKNEAALGQK